MFRYAHRRLLPNIQYQTMTNFPISYADVTSAREQLRGVANVTPVQTSRTLNAQLGREFFFKCENFQRTGSFKFRGAYNAISRLDENVKGVVAFSSGNHAQAVALAAKLRGKQAVIVMPHDAPQIKREATQGYGAEVVTYQRGVENRAEVAKRIAQERGGLTLIPPFDHPHVMAGQGTLMAEWMEQVEGLDAVVIPVGGGGLISGCSIAAKAICPEMRVFGVETEGADDVAQSLAKGERVTIPDPATIADGIRTTAPGELTFPVMQKLVEQVAVVSDADVMDALRFQILRMKLVSEPTGAVALAALLAGKIPVECKRVGVLICGGNIEPAMLARLFR